MVTHNKRKFVFQIHLDWSQVTCSAKSFNGKTTGSYKKLIWLIQAARLSWHLIFDTSCSKRQVITCYKLGPWYMQSNMLDRFYVDWKHVHPAHNNLIRKCVLYQHPECIALDVRKYEPNVMVPLIQVFIRVEIHVAIWLINYPWSHDFNYPPFPLFQNWISVFLSE